MTTGPAYDAYVLLPVHDQETGQLVGHARVQAIVRTRANGDPSIHIAGLQATLAGNHFQPIQPGEPQ